MSFSLAAFQPALAEDSGYYRQGKLAFSGRNYDRAYDLFQKALQANPSNGNPLFYMGYILEQQNRRNDAVGAYERAVNLRMDRDLREKAYWKIVLHYKFARDWENLYVYSEKFLQFNDSSGVRKLHELADQNRDPRVAKVNRLMQDGRKHAKEGRVDEAAAAYHQALIVKNDHHPARWELALARMQLKEYGAAEDDLRVLIRSDAQRWEYHYKAGICNLQMDRYDAALRDMERARDLNEKPGKSFVYYVNLAEGLAYLERDAFAIAHERFEAALKVRATPRLYGALARAQWELGKFADAEASSERALKKEPAQADAFLVKTLSTIRKNSSRAYPNSLELLGDLEKEHKTGAAPERFTPVLLYLGREAAKREKWELALRAFEKVNMKRLQALYESERREDPDRKTNSLREYNFHYGVALFNADRDRQAIITLKRVEDSPEADYLIARAYSREKNASGARSYLKKAATARQQYWQTALLDDAIQKLMRENADFDYFVRNRGREPEPAGPAEPDSNPDSAPDAQAAGIRTNP
ncbi:MAG: tetratricopeptide repeat protein [Leptospirales bacterium]